jgi:isopenicillin-N N-acyltransferase-like protein
MHPCIRSKVLFAAVVVMAVLAARPAAAADRYFPEKEFAGGKLAYEGEIPVLHLSGAPEAMGKQSAALATAKIKPLLDIPRKLLDDSGVGAGWPIIVQGAKHMFKAAPARYREELEAAGKEAGLSPDEIGSLYVANAMVELRRMGGCSGLLVMPERSATGEMIFGRNLDFPNIGGLTQLSLVTVYRPEGKHAFAAIGFPAQVGVISGMNDAGLCLATFDSYSAKDGSPMFNPKGVPLALLNRQIMEECETVADARKLLEASPRTTMMSLVICDRESAAVFELTPNNVVQRDPVKDVLICTNHFVSPKLSVTNECWRYDKLLEYRASKAPLGVKDVARSLHEVNQGTFTLQSMVFQPSTMELSVSFGAPPTSARPLRTLDLSEELAVVEAVK